MKFNTFFPVRQTTVIFKITVVLAALLVFSAPAQAQKNPSLLWATYFGGDTTTYGGILATDSSGNVYMTDNTYCNGLATAGAFQTSGDSVNGTTYLAKFSPTGSLLWATYYGSNNGFGLGGITVDKSGNVWITGAVGNDSGIVATQGAYQTKFGGGAADAFLAKFSPTGSLLYSSYFGGPGDEGAAGIVIDSLGNIYISGNTTSTSGIATKGTYKTNGDSINGDIFLAKFSPTNSLLWATYYGGNHQNQVDGLTIDNSNNLYITGYTTSTVGIATSGTYKTSGDSINGSVFLAKFSPTGSMLWGTYYGGNKYSESFGVATDIYKSIYMTGYTLSTSGIATSGAYQTSGDSINGDAFIAKFSPSGSLFWATFFGGNGDDEGNDVAINKSGNVFITGYTNSKSSIATIGAYQTSDAGTYNAFLAKFSTSGNLLYGTYSGGNGNTFGGGIAIDLSGYVYYAGITSSASGIATKGTFQTLNNSTGYDAFLAKFHIQTLYNDVGIFSVISPKGSFCADSMPVKVQLKNYSTDTLKAVNIGWEINSRLQTTYKWTGNLVSGSATVVTIGTHNFSSGTDTIVAWTSPIGFFDTVPGNDTAKIIDTVNALPDAFFTHKLSDDTVKFTPFNTTYSDYSWSFGDKDTSNQISPSHPYINNGTYTVALTVTDKNGCMATYQTTDTLNYTGLPNSSQPEMQVNIYPNPFNSQTTIEATVHENEPVSVAIYDMTGRQITDEVLRSATFLKSGTSNVLSQFTYTFDAAQYGCGSGMYVVKVVAGDAVVEREVVRIR